MSKLIKIVAFSLLITQYSFSQKRPSKAPDRIIQTFTNTFDNSRAVTWRTHFSLKQGYALITEAVATPKILNKVDTIPAQREVLIRPGYSATYYSVKFDSLTLGKQYAYKVGHGKHWSEWFQFKAGSADTNKFSFLYYGDAQNDIKSYCSRTFRGSILNFPETDFLLHAGDLINHANYNREWGEWYYAGSWIFSTYPNIVAPGNHEYANTILHGHQGILSCYWRPSFTLPDNGPENHKENVYYVDYKNARIIVLDTRDMLLDDENAKEQVVWLESVLKNCKKKWIIVTHHHPAVGIRNSKEGVYTGIVATLLKPLYDKYGVDLVLQGHDHIYARGSFPVTDPTSQGPVYTVSVSGPKMYKTSNTYFYAEIVQGMQLYQHIQVSDDSIWYRSFNVIGELIDEFKIVKSGSNKELITK